MDTHRRAPDRKTNRRWLQDLVIAAVFFATICPALAQQAQQSEVRIVSSPLGSGPGETTYEVRSGSCRIRWTVARSGVNAGIAQHRAECSLPLSEQIALNSRILDKVIEVEPTFRTLFLGRLKPFPELSVRLAAAAKRSPEWDAERGRPRSSRPLAPYLMDVFSSSEPSVFAEWKRLFEQKQLTFAVSGVEEVSVGAAGSLPFFPQLTTEGVKPGDRVPFDCLIWFSAVRQQ
jgi:hypothetical protein